MQGDLSLHLWDNERKKKIRNATEFLPTKFKEDIRRRMEQKRSKEASLGNLETLDIEILWMIFQFLDVKTLLSTATVSCHFHNK